MPSTVLVSDNKLTVNTPSSNFVNHPVIQADDTYHIIPQNYLTEIVITFFVHVELKGGSKHAYGPLIMDVGCTQMNSMLAIPDINFEVDLNTQKVTTSFTIAISSGNPPSWCSTITENVVFFNSSTPNATNPNDLVQLTPSCTQPCFNLQFDLSA